MEEVITSSANSTIELIDLRTNSEPEFCKDKGPADLSMSINDCEIIINNDGSDFDRYFDKAMHIFIDIDEKIKLGVSTMTFR